MADEVEKCSCGYEEGTFACKIRHVQVNTANLKRSREADGSNNFGLTEQK